MLALEFTKKVETIKKVLNIIDSSNIIELKQELLGYEEKHIAFIEKHFYTSNEEKNKDNLSDEMKSLSPSSNIFFKKYYRSIVRANANLEMLLHTLEKDEIEMLKLDKGIILSRQIEDYMFNIEGNKELSIKNIRTLTSFLEELFNLENKLKISSDVFTSLQLVKKPPENYKDLEITFYTTDVGIETFSSRILAIKLLYEIMLRLNNLTENDKNRLIILKTEKEDTEYYKIAGVSNLIMDMYYLIKEWVKDFVEGTSPEEKEVIKLGNIKNLESKIKAMIDKNQINSATGEKYFDVIKKSLINLQIEKCSSIELYSENISISNIAKASLAQFQEENEYNTPKAVVHETPKVEEKQERAYAEKVSESKEDDTLKKLESSILLKSTIPPADQKSVDALLKKGITLMSIKRYTEAISYFDKAIELKVNYAEAYNYKANAFIQCRRFGEAIKLTENAIALKPDYKDAYLNKGTALFSLKKHEEALEQYKKTVELDPKYSEGFFNLGSCFMMINGRKKDAIEAFSRAIEINSTYSAAYYNRACAYVAEKEFDLCIKDLELAIKMDKNFKNMLKFDSDFSNVQEDPRFKALVS